MDPPPIEKLSHEDAIEALPVKPPATSGLLEAVAMELAITQRMDQSDDRYSVSPLFVESAQSIDPLLLRAEVDPSPPRMELAKASMSYPPTHPRQKTEGLNTSHSIAGDANHMLKGAWKKPLAPHSNHSQDLLTWPILSAQKISNKKKSQADAVPRLQLSGNYEVIHSENMMQKFAEDCSESDNSTNIKLKEISSRFPWAAKMNPKSRNLHRVTSPSYMDDGTPKVLIPDDVLLQGLENQKEYVIGQFYRCSVPSGGLIHAVLNRIWGRKCKIFVRKLGEFSYIFHIPDAATRSWVLQRGLWHVDDCIMFVAPWSSGASLSLPEITTIPVWVTLKSIPSQLYSILGIKWIASGLGEPMQTIKPWLDPTMLGEAKIMVELELDKPFPQRIAAEDREGNISMIAVEYSWLPTKCERCGQLGHKEKRCLLPLGQRSKGFMPATSASVALASSTCPFGVVFDQAAIVDNTKVINPATSIQQTPEITTSPIATASTFIFNAASNDSPSPKETIPAIDMTTALVTVPPTSKILSEVATCANFTAASDANLTTTSFSKEAPKYKENSVGTLPIATASLHIGNLHFTTDMVVARKVSCDGSDLRPIVSPTGTSTENCFALLDEPDEDMYSDPNSDVEPNYENDLMTSSAKRILRDRPVKPSQKAQEMVSHSLRGGRGTRGFRGKRGRGGKG